ncbi:MAG: hypothetical protein P8N76_14305 [Pirellulaceae bacterium]|nr:hypothetical protein [Pirellulaceae bacterium]
MSTIRTRTTSLDPVRDVSKEQFAAAQTKTTAAHCLVASTVQAKREFLSDAATQAGWDTVVCADAQNATTAARRAKFQMAWVDLDHHGQTSSGFRELCQTLAATPSMLLAVCGHERDPKEEIWARQLGVWLYLPGISIDQVDEISLLCEQAQLITNRFQTAY